MMFNEIPHYVSEDWKIFASQQVNALELITGMRKIYSKA